MLPHAALNGVCPYFTMFPLSFPLDILRRNAHPGEVVLDPFCGRGTTNLAGRMLGLSSFGIDSSPVAEALSQAKLARASVAEIMGAARDLLSECPSPTNVPSGEFWEWAYYPEVLDVVCRLREGLLRDCTTDARRALRAVLLGALHGPQNKGQATYLSNQSQRTYAPKPSYAVKFWTQRNLRPRVVNVLEVLELRARRYYGENWEGGRGAILLGDSRDQQSHQHVLAGQRANWVITSPPYYGVNTYIPDQWLRHWFVGGPATVDYSTDTQLQHRSPSAFVGQMRIVWRNAREVSAANAHLVVRFGGINDRRVDPLSLVRASLSHAGWRIAEVRPAGTALRGKRQAVHFSGQQRSPIAEHDIWAVAE